jgi:hypothetical protein
MALQIRRGVDGSGAGGRLTITPTSGELLYTTDTKTLYIGDGTTAGGNIIGSGLNNVVEDTSPQLGGDLDINGKKLVSTSNGNIIIDPDGTGYLSVRSTLVIGDSATGVDGNLIITRDSYSSATTSGLLFTQHHNNVDAVNWTMYRSRGTSIAPTVVGIGDDLGELAFAGFDGTNPIAGAVVTATVDGVVTTNRVPTKLTFITNSTTGLGVRAELSSTGVWKVNDIQNVSGSTLTLTATTVNVAANMQINAQGDLRFADTDSSNWVAFQAPGTLAANVTWTLPAADGTSGQVLSTNGLGTLSWATASGGTGLVSRTAVSETTSILANGATGTISITGAKGYILYKIQTSVAAWVRIYTSVAARTADSSRAEGIDPVPGAGVIAEVITTGAATIVMSPGVIGFNDETNPTTAIALAVTNKSGSSSTVTTTLTILQIEA